MNVEANPAILALVCAALNAHTRQGGNTIAGAHVKAAVVSSTGRAAVALEDGTRYTIAVEVMSA